ncbi:DUF3822 family protein [Belliella sp. DSM 111904]|uniref:DUF3822 family protein n=1 Tax=Belliella filtrata TaxID=2923435 RepID=A0ABS9V0I1_9BACT|nr:DUF3822 family protein [Belliella filtrata]MCH7409912.1 DUF3822 family protein [Belliella filtrata]
MANSLENIQENKYSDKFDTNLVSSLSLLLFEEKYILFAKDGNEAITAIHQKFFSDYASLKDVLQRDKLFNLQVPAKILIYDENFALIPGVLFDINQLSTYLSFAQDPSTSQADYFSSIDSNNLYIAGAISLSLHEILTKGRQKAKIHHGSTSFLAYLLKDKSTYLNQEIFIYLRDKHCFIAAFKNNQLANFNTYAIESKESLLNYSFGILSQLNFDRKYCKVTVMGDYLALNIDQDFGNKYFKNFVLTQPKQNQKYLSGVEVFLNSPLFEAHWEYN